MKSETKSYSVFDDIDNSTPFEFTKPDTKHSKSLAKNGLTTENVLCKALESEFSLQGTFKIQGDLIVQYKTEEPDTPSMVLEITNAKIKDLEFNFTNPKYKFQINKNGAAYEFFFVKQETAEAWIQQLKFYCIQAGFHNSYQPLALLGEGAFASVHLVQAKGSKEQYAVKGFPKESLKNSAGRTAVINEIFMMRSHDHPNLIKLHEVHETEGSVYIIMEYIQSKTLRSVIRKPDFRNSELQTIQIINSILHGIAYLAAHGVMHRDLKPDNILIGKAVKVKIIDFGLVTKISMTDCVYERCGTPGYIAPEVFRYDRKVPSTSYNDKVDVFSAGSILFQMLFGFRLFNAEGGANILELNKSYNYAKTAEIINKEMADPMSKINKQGLHLLLLMLDSEPRKRITANDALKHPYFKPVVNRMVKFNSSKDIILLSADKYKTSSDPLSPLYSPLASASKGSCSKYSTGCHHCLHTLNGERSPAKQFHFKFNVNSIILAEKTKTEVEDETKVAPDVNNKYASNNLAPLKGSKGRNLVLNIRTDFSKNNNKNGGVRTSLFCDVKKTNKKDDCQSLEKQSEVPSTEGETEEIYDVGEEDCNIKEYFDNHKRNIVVKNPGKKNVARVN